MGRYVTFDGGSRIGKKTIIVLCKERLRMLHKGVHVLKENDCPFRDIGEAIIPWCEKYGIDRQSFLFSLFVTSGTFVERELECLMARHDIILRDRSFISSLAYRCATGMYTPEAVWDLYVNYLRFRIPDLAVIVDADPDTTAFRLRTRKENDIGFEGLMSCNRLDRREVRRNFLLIPQLFMDQVCTVVVTNDAEVREDNPHALDSVVAKIIATLFSGETDD